MSRDHLCKQRVLVLVNGTAEFKISLTSLEYEPLEGLSKTTTTNENTGRIHEVILNDRHMELYESPL